MVRATLAAVAVVAATLVLTATAFSHTTAAPTLVGTVGPRFHIALTKGGKVVKTLNPGSYKFLIHDKASIHAF